MSHIHFEAHFDGEDALRGAVQMSSDPPPSTLQGCLFSLDLALRRFACQDLPEALKPRPLKLYPAPPLEAFDPKTIASTAAKPYRAQQPFDHMARVRQYLNANPPDALRPRLEGRPPRGLALTVFVDTTCRLHLASAFHALPPRTRAQILIDWRDSLVRQAADRGLSV